MIEIVARERFRLPGLKPAFCGLLPLRFPWGVMLAGSRGRRGFLPEDLQAFREGIQNDAGEVAAGFHFVLSVSSLESW